MVEAATIHAADVVAAATKATADSVRVTCATGAVNCATAADITFEVAGRALTRCPLFNST